MKVLFAALLSATAMGQAGEYQGQKGEWHYVKRTGEIKWLGGQFSEENGGFGPRAPVEAFVGWACYGGNCDNRQMRYFDGGPAILSASNDILTASDISEESGGGRQSNMNCGNRLLSRQRCKGGNCDNTDVYCRDLAQGYRIDPDVYKVDFYGREFSEEHPAWFDDCPPDMWLWGMQCFRDRCDNQKLRCAKVQKFYKAVNCEVSAWGEPGECSKTCGGGQQTLKRTVTKAAAYGGAACPALEMTQACNEQDCKCQGQKNSDAYINRLTKVKKGTNLYMKLADDNDDDPICECYDLCKASDLGADVFMYFVKKNGSAKCKCSKANPDKFNINMKERTGYTSGFITDAGKKALDAKKNKKSRRRRG